MKFPNLNRLDIRINLVVVAVSGMLLVAVLTLLVNNIQDLTLAIGQNRVEQEVEMVVGHLNTHQHEDLDQAKLLARHPDFIKAVLSKDKNRIRTAILSNAPHLASDHIHVADSSGESLLLLEAPDNNYDPATESQLIALGLLGVETNDILANQANPELFQLITIVPIQASSGQIMGSLLVRNNLDDHFIEEINLFRHDVQLDLIHNHQVVATTTHEPPTPLSEASQAIVKQVSNNSQAYIMEELTTIDGTPYVAAYLPLIARSENQGTIRVLVNLSQIAAFKDSFIYTASGLIILLGTFAIILIVLVLRLNLVNPMRRLQLAAQGMAAGNYRHRAPATSADEIGELSHTFNQMADAIQEREAKLVQEINERKQAEDELKASEARYRAVIEDQTELICRQKPDGTLTFVNDAYCRFFGKTREALIDRPFWDLLVDEDSSELRQKLAALTPDNPTVSAEHRECRADGNLRWLRWIDRGIFDETGRLVEIQAVGHDITERKLAEEALKEREAMLRTMTEHAPEAILVGDMDTGLFVDANENAVKLFGLERADLLKIGPAELSPPLQPDGQPSAETAMAFIQQALEGKTPVFEWIHQNASGELIACEVRLVRLPATGRTLIRSSVTNITNRKQREQEREQLLASEREQRLQAETLTEIALALTAKMDHKAVLDEILYQVNRLVPYTAANIMLLDDNKLQPAVWRGYDRNGGSDLFATISLDTDTLPFAAKTIKTGQPALILDTRQEPQWGKFTETAWIRSTLVLPFYAQDQLLGLLWLDSDTPHTFSDEDIKRIQPLVNAAAVALENTQLYQQAQQELAARKQAEAALRRAHGQLERRVEQRTADLAKANNLLLQQITEKEMVEESLRQAKEAAESASQAKSEFLANMSHELRTPLNAIIGFSEVLSDETFGPLNEKQTKYTNNVINSGRHLLHLVEDILDVAKIEAGQMQLRPAIISVVDIVAELESSLNSLVVEKNHTLTIDIENDLPSLIMDPKRFRQILYNLTGNAIKYTPPGGLISVKAETKPALYSNNGQSDENLLQISITDNGIGISPENLNRIFNNFEQVDSSYRREQGGTGIGLSLTRRLVELHGGLIWAESAGEGQGSTFTVQIPLDTTKHQTVINSIGQRQTNETG